MLSQWNYIVLAKVYSVEIDTPCISIEIDYLFALIFLCFNSQIHAIISTVVLAHVSLNDMKEFAHVHPATFLSMANVEISTNALTSHAIVQRFVKIILVALCVRAQKV